ncbi:MAG: 3-isopropylmalate dehydratase [Verrucomicrobiae bacterium]|nr:3-isopropylmalate dehydratase [Verrucomicrobiae bacterium]
MSTILEGALYVMRDNVDTDQIIPAQYLNLVPTIPEEYEKLGGYALIGLSEAQHPERFIAPGELKTRYPLLIAGRNFGCGSSREHAPIALGAAGAQAVIAESYARIFFRNCVATGELYPIESAVRLCDTLKTGQIGRLDLDAGTLVVEGVIHRLKPLGEARPVIDAGGLFKYARRNHLIPVR